MSNVQIKRDESMTQALLGLVHFEDGYNMGQIGVAFDGEVSLNMLGRKNPNGFDIDLIGRHPLPVHEENNDALVNWTDVTHMPPSLQDISVVGKGVGRRLYSTPSAALGFPGQHALGLFAAPVRPNAVTDCRESWHETSLGKLVRIGQHAGKIIEARCMPDGLERIAKRSDRLYGNADAAIWSQPPRAAMRQNSRGSHEELLPATFAITRISILQRVGIEYQY